MWMQIIQAIDQIVTGFIFIPVIIVLVKKLNIYKKWGKRTILIYRICLVLVVLFLVRTFCRHFIFSPVNAHRFTDNALVQALFYE